jgi:hypothetical protein
MAYRTGDGRLHGSRIEAAIYEAQQRLEKCLGNPGFAVKVLENGRNVFEALHEVLYAEGIVEVPARLKSDTVADTRVKGQPANV